MGRHPARLPAPPSLLRRAHRLARTPTTRCLTSTDRGMSTELAVGARVRLNPRRLMPVAAGSPPAPGPVTGCGPPGHGPDAHNGPSPMEVIRPEGDTPWKGIGRLRGLSAARPSREGIMGGTIDAAAPPFRIQAWRILRLLVICRVRSTRQAPVRMKRPGDRLLPALARRPTRRCYGFASGRLQRSSAGPGRPTKFTKDRHRADLSCLAAFAAAST
jgi:hypothetical protein